MDSTFERFLDGIREFLKKARSGELSNDDEEYLRILADTKKRLENLQETGECDHTEVLKNLCQAVLYGDYIIVRNNSAVFSQKVNDVEEMESKGMPEVLQPKIKEIKGYLAKLSELIKNMDNLATKVHNKVNDVLESDSELTDKEIKKMKFLKIDFETVVKQTTDYFNQADRVLKMFESDVVSYKNDEKNKLCIYAGLTLFATVATAGAAGAVVGMMGAAGAAGAVGGGSGILMAGSYFIYSEQCKKVNVECEKLNSELRKLKAKEKENNSTFEGELKKANELNM